MRIEWTQEAIINLDTIYNFISFQNQNAAVKIYNTILDETDILKTFPYLAPVESLLEEEFKYFRGLVILGGRFKVIYFIQNEIVYITHVWDCRRNPALLQKEIQQIKKR